jgi:hypothetical protein
VEEAFVGVLAGAERLSAPFGEMYGMVKSRQPAGLEDRQSGYERDSVVEAVHELSLGSFNSKGVNDVSIHHLRSKVLLNK